jgi:hypothetical protein
MNKNTFRKFIQAHKDWTATKNKKYDIVSKLRQIQFLNSEIKQYFHCFDSVWHNIKKHIEDEDRCVLIDRPNRYSKCVLKNVFLFVPESWEPLVEGDYACYEVELTSEPYIRTKHFIDVPISLMEHFCLVDFNKWVKEVDKKHFMTQQFNNDMKIVEDIIKKYPDRVVDMLEIAKEMTSRGE